MSDAISEAVTTQDQIGIDLEGICCGFLEFSNRGDLHYVDPKPSTVKGKIHFYVFLLLLREFNQGLNKMVL